MKELTKCSIFWYPSNFPPPKVISTWTIACVVSLEIFRLCCEARACREATIKRCPSRLVSSRKLNDHETAAVKLTCRRQCQTSVLRTYVGSLKTFLSFLLTTTRAKPLLRQCLCSDVRTFILGGGWGSA